MIFGRGNNPTPTLSVVLTEDAATREFSGIHALATWLTRRVGPLFTAALERIADRNTSIQEGADDQNAYFRRENANLRAILSKTQAELTCALQREQRSLFLALHDDLTALPNRRFFLERLGSALKNQDSIPAKVAVIYLDLDGFKVLNDTYGHANGDALLGLIATRLAHALRAEDLVSRIGGDEFACLITGVSSRERLQHIALTLFEVVSAPFKIGTLALNVRPSIGVAMCPMDGTTVEALMQAADAAMYGAKRNRSSFSFSSRLRALSH
jgi:diguanylate cyclase (GGDEF)-like protein